jgi:hypothetical protein
MLNFKIQALNSELRDVSTLACVVQGRRLIGIYFGCVLGAGA